MRPLPRVRRDEDGQVLVLALVFVTVISVMIGSLFFLGYGAFASTHALHVSLDKQYTADAAVGEAINALSYPPNVNAETQYFPTQSTVPCVDPTHMTTPGSGSSPGDVNPVSISYPGSTYTVYTYCTYISDAFLVRNIEVTASTANLTPPITTIPSPLLRAYVTLSQQAPIDPIVVTVDDWSVLSVSPN